MYVYLLTFVSLPKVVLQNESFLCRPSRKLLHRNLAITDLCVGIVLEPIAVIYIAFPFSTKDRIFAILYCRNSWENEYKALGLVISVIVRLSGQAVVMVMNGCWYLRQPLASYKRIKVRFVLGGGGSGYFRIFLRKKSWPFHFLKWINA